MKTSYILIFSIAVVFTGCKATEPDAVRGQATNNKLENPPGTVWLTDSSYMDQTEVKNLDYYEYVCWLRKYDIANYTAALPDTTVWRDKKNYNEPYVQYYLRHPAYRDFPVVGVSYEQATAYCKWRTERVKEYAKLVSKRHSKNYALYQKVEYRLPTKAEWEYAASAGGTNENTGFKKILTAENKPKIWVQESFVLYAAETNGNDIFTSVKDGSPNRFGFYNMIGNVSEMTIDKGVSKGGSAFNTLDECRIGNDMAYDKPSARVGFRCVCIIHK